MSHPSIPQDTHPHPQPHIHKYRTYIRCSLNNVNTVNMKKASKAPFSFSMKSTLLECRTIHMLTTKWRMVPFYVFLVMDVVVPSLGMVQGMLLGVTGLHACAGQRQLVNNSLRAEPLRCQGNYSLPFAVFTIINSTGENPKLLCALI